MSLIPVDDKVREAAIQVRREELLTVKEYASLVREHEMSVYRRIRVGRQVGVVRIGRTIRIDLARATRPDV